jgi:hypothetical protein
VWSGGRDCTRGDVAGRWRADVWNILGGGSGGGGFGYGVVSPEHANSEAAICASAGDVARKTQDENGQIHRYTKDTIRKKLFPTVPLRIRVFVICLTKTQP